MRLYPTTGLTDERFSELYRRVDDMFEWDTRIGRPPALGLREALVVTLMYFRRNVAQEFLAALFEVDQSTISRTIAKGERMIDAALDGCVPDLAQTLRGDTAIVDGSLLPCWSWARGKELYSSEHKTTGHNVRVVTNMDGELCAISDPLPGSTHDKKALDESGLLDVLDIDNTIADKGYQGTGAITPKKRTKKRELHDSEKEYDKEINKIRYVVERAIANIKNWRILHTDYRRPIETFGPAFNALRKLIFFTEGFA